ncbi:MAG: hypothetical protein IKV94_01340 [Clostridia bacterium]|nr:hypothetical protein [Clostridia bacterium]
MSIPKITKEELLNRYEHIKPVVTVNGKLYYLREFTPKELSNLSYIWNISEDIREEVGEKELEILADKNFVCLHSYGYYGLFKPSIAEVLSQIKDYDIPFVSAFEIIESPKISKDSFSSIAFNNGYHVSTVRLYRKKG